ncbi:MAG: alanine:cation symporter family protein [Clostridia bacterium]|nr:alanine:cation symporter family protein [Clostridia bacterium]
MEAVWKWIADVNGAVNGVVWGPIGLVLLIGAGVVLTCCVKFFQVGHLGHWWKHTMGSFFKKSEKKEKTEKKSISQFQALCTALAATVGTGNIAGVATAIVIGGPGAVFWMLLAAFFGMITKFAEIVLGIYFRRRNPDGEWSGGTMYTLKDGLGKKKGFKTVGSVLAVLFAVFTILASFGIGNMSQINSIMLNIKTAFFNDAPVMIGGYDVLPLIIGLVLTVIVALVVLGGLQRVATVAEKLVPFMAVLYIVGSLVVIGINYQNILPAIGSIFTDAFTGQAAAGGVIGTVIVQGCKRGVFSNEAGLGSSTMVHASADVKEPVKQGLWGIFEVFMDTFVICLLTALTVLCSSANTMVNSENASTAVTLAYAQYFGQAGKIIVAVALTLFAFTTVLGWSQYGGKAVEYLFGVKGAKVYKVIFSLMTVSGAVMTSSLAWDVSDTFNGLMMIPNLIGLVALCPLLIKLTKNYVDRHIKGKQVEPMLSYDPKLQKEMQEPETVEAE